MKTTNTIFLAFLLSACLFITLAQEEEEPWWVPLGGNDWGYDPNYIPDGVMLPDSNVGFDLTCDNMDKAWWTLQKLVRCRDPYPISGQDIQVPYVLAEHTTRLCGYVTNNQAQRLQYNNQAPFVAQYVTNFVPSYPGYGTRFVETSSTTTDAQDSIAEKVGRKSHHNQQTVFAQTEQYSNQLKFPTYPEGVWAYSADGDELHSIEECYESFVENPHYRGPVNYTDIERLVSMDLLLIANYRFDQTGYCANYCNDVMKPMWEKWGHFPGDGVNTNTQAILWYYSKAIDWYWLHFNNFNAICFTPTFDWGQDFYWM